MKRLTNEFSSQFRKSAELEKELNWVRFIKLIGRANAELARYDGILQGIINPVVLLSPLTTKEAVISSKIEGTQASLHEVLEFEAAPDPANEKYHDRTLCLWAFKKMSVTCKGTLR